ncbi:MAG: flagellin [Clostridium sp.]|nr:flagellin [Clostridium sp.]
MRLSHNIPSLNIYSKYSKAIIDQTKAMKNISSGKRVDTASDDPYALAQSDQFNMEIRGLQMSSTNSQDAVSLLQTTDGGMDGMTSMLQRIRSLAVQSANGTESDSDRQAIQAETKTLVDGIDNLSKSTNINDVNLIAQDGTSTKTVMVGGNVGETLQLPTYNLTAAALNLKDSSGNYIDLSTEAGAKAAINTIDSAISTIGSARSNYGAISNRLSSVISNSSDINIVLQTADSNITDADIASEMMRYSRDSIISQAGIAMMAQTNKFPQDVLNILQNIK